MFKKTLSIVSVAGLVFVLAFGASQASAGVITDDFNTSHDYSGGNVSGTIWDGVLNTGNADGVDANISQTEKLVIDTSTDQSDSTGDVSYSAPTLYLNVSGDFDVQVQIPDTALLNQNFESQGIVAFHDVTNLVEVLNIYANGGNIRRFREYTDGVRTRDIENGYKSWLRMTRTGDDFEGFHSDDGNTWTSFGPTFTRADLPDTLKIGLFAATANTLGNLEAEFDNFTVTVVPEPSALVLLGIVMLGPLSLRPRR